MYKEKENKKHDFHSSRGWNPRLWCLQIWCLVSILFLVHRWPTSPTVLTWQKGQGEVYSIFSKKKKKALIPFMRDPPSWSKHLQRPHFQHQFIGHLCFNIRILEGHKHSDYSNHHFHLKYKKSKAQKSKGTLNKTSSWGYNTGFWSPFLEPFYFHGNILERSD